MIGFIGFIAVLIVWSLILICMGINIGGKHYENRLESIKRSRDFHKDQKEMFVDHARRIVKENNNLKERNLQLIHENKRLKKELDNSNSNTYNYYINR